MDLLNDIIRGLLNEEAQIVNVLDAIKKRYGIVIKYDPRTEEEKKNATSETSKGLGAREIVIGAYGKTKLGKPVIRAYQYQGASTSEKSHGWKFFLLNNIVSWQPERKKKLPEPPPDEWKMDGNFNVNGDKSMSTVFVIADFSGAEKRYNRGGLKRYNDERANKKRENDPYYDFQKNIEKNKYNKGYSHIDKNIADWEREQAAKQQRREKQNRIDNKGNDASVNDMQRAQNFPDNTMQTVGPVMKGGNNDVKTNDNTKPLNYNNAKQEGPIYKNDITSPTEPQSYDSSDNNKEEKNINNGSKQI